ncbi:ThuA domain-containing protein [Bryobacter aggregatus]|uniref:ThuA domain-containing protein n=1 Tax=Bryobacter aggregatus TaxID=360054 RepID=UPI000689B252|nr:ThuA domain-containing protein [Bryobacter aggregatus]
MHPFSTWTRGQFLLSPLFVSAAHPAPKIVFVCGDHEYSGEITLPLFAKELTARYGLDCQILRSSPDQNAETNIPGLEALDSASLAIFFLRWRQLPQSQLVYIDRYIHSHKPIIGLRTSSHAFHYAATEELSMWNRWASDVFGAPPGWEVDGHTHYGHQSTTRVSLNPKYKRHPILRDLPAEFTAPSWLYKVAPKYPPDEAQVLLWGDAINPNKPSIRNPVAWTWRNAFGANAFYTSLGHPGDFALEPFQRLLVNAIYSSLGRKHPKSWTGPMPIRVPYRGIVKS